MQKAAFAIILGDEYKTYTSALQKLEMTTLTTRRKELCLKFAHKSQKVKNLAIGSANELRPFRMKKTRSKFSEYLPVLGRTSGFAKKSLIAYLTSLLNEKYYI